MFLNFLRLAISIFVIVIIVPQTLNDNVLLRVLNDSKIFGNYSETKKNLNFLTWSLIFIFLGTIFFTDFIF